MQDDGVLSLEDSVYNWRLGLQLHKPHACAARQLLHVWSAARVRGANMRIDTRMNKTMHQIIVFYYHAFML